ncbi:hypothetical protein [Tistrella mobilis]|uniref:hypothetical protein n=1 Tax=Tistrella mobilis TaxID=171437 RepID=UPI0035565C22
MQAMRALLLTTIGLLVTQAASGTERVTLPQPFSMAYYESWEEIPVALGSATRLAMTPDHVDVQVLGFVKPDLVYPGGLDLTETGLQAPVPGPVLADAVRALKARAPAMKVLLAVGGSGYVDGWRRYDPRALARLVTDLGLDGVDLDYEPAKPDCQTAEARRGPTVVCRTDLTWSRLIADTRAVLPRPMMLSIPGWSTGAYGSGAFQTEPPGGPYTGSMLWLGRDREAAAAVDLVAIMAYAAGPSYDPERAFAAYRAIWDGPLALGLIVPPDPTGQPVPAIDAIRDLAARLKNQEQAGVMVYGMLGTPPSGPSAATPSGGMMLRAVCEGFGRDGCDAVLP